MTYNTFQIEHTILSLCESHDIEVDRIELTFLPQHASMSLNFLDEPYVATEDGYCVSVSVNTPIREVETFTQELIFSLKNIPIHILSVRRENSIRQNIHTKDNE